MRKKKICFLIVAVMLYSVVCWGDENERMSDYRLWEKGVNLNELLANNLELQMPDIEGYKNCLAISEYCPYCGAFSFYHKLKERTRKCVRCGNEWTTKKKGNIYFERALGF